MFDRSHLWSHLVLDFCLLGVFYSQFQFKYLWLACSYFLFLLGSVLGDYTILRICPFLPGYPFYCHIVVHNSLIILCISALSVVTSPFSFLILSIWFFSLFFLISLHKVLSILFIFSKNQLLVLLIFTITYFISFSFISAPIFMISFFLLILGVFLFFFFQLF